MLRTIILGSAMSPNEMSTSELTVTGKSNQDVETFKVQHSQSFHPLVVNSYPPQIEGWVVNDNQVQICVCRRDTAQLKTMVPLHARVGDDVPTWYLE